MAAPARRGEAAGARGSAARQRPNRPLKYVRARLLSVDFSHMDVEGFVRAYIKAVESGATGDDLAAYYHADFIQKEFPNRILVRGAVRTFAGLLFVLAARCSRESRGSSIGRARQGFSRQSEV